MRETGRSDSFANVKCPGRGALIPSRRAPERTLGQQAGAGARAAIAEREAGLAARERSLAEAASQLDARVEERLAAALPELEEKARVAAATSVELELRDARADAAAKAQRLAELQERE